jgi:hypothetical protein
MLVQLLAVDNTEPDCFALTIRVMIFCYHKLFLGNVTNDAMMDGLTVTDNAITRQKCGSPLMRSVAY